ncbi:hypothetical protein X975_14319, partial [Stegodyphus mimosarum]
MKCCKLKNYRILRVKTKQQTSPQYETRSRQIRQTSCFPPEQM